MCHISDFDDPNDSRDASAKASVDTSHTVAHTKIYECEECGKTMESRGDHDLCETCDEKFYCECGQRLEDSYGTPGDGFCVRCR